MSAHPTPPAAKAGQPLSDRVYPAALRERELALLRRRRAKVGQDVPAESINGFPADTVGLALSGGGIRSATFCLGVFQALARLKLLGRVDYLSTVSGGGYLGSFWGAWLDRIQRGEQDLAEKDFAAAEAALANPKSKPVWWLRENGRFLTPRGGDDTWLAAAVYNRSLLMVQFLLTMPVLLWFCFMNITRFGMSTYHLPRAIPLGSGAPALFLSPFFVLTISAVIFYLLNTVFFWRRSVQADPARLRRYNHLLKFCAQLSVFTAALGVIDTVSATVFWWMLFEPRGLGAVVGTLATATVAVYGFSGKIKSALEALGVQDEIARNPRLGVIAASCLIQGLWLTSVSFLSHFLTLIALAQAGVSPELMAGWDAPLVFDWRAFVPFAMAGLVMLLLLRHGWLVNATSMASFYHARLTRAYLGATNPQRHAATRDAYATDPLPGDNIDWRTYRPHAAGGPLHFVNVTLNQTYDSRSNVVQQDRKGLNFAVGPAAVSVGLVHHAEWLEKDGGVRTGAIRALSPDPGKFHLFGLYREDSASGAPPVPAELPAESLTLGQWVGISGAAFTPGLGARTERALSFLLTFFNVRLGWWWDSGLATAGARRGFISTPGEPKHERRLGLVRYLLLGESNARFPGGSRRYWYLSDGGHFENTAAYELLRRRLPFIIVLDCGCDPARQFEDYANLVRKARIDFNAEVTEITPTPKFDVNPAAHAHLGTLPEVATRADQTGYSAKAAFLARADFKDDAGRTAATSLLLFLKPTLTGAEPADILNYHAQNPLFPQEPTTDQFFDEAQWESYRKLGVTLATQVFAHVPGAASFRQAFFRV